MRTVTVKNRTRRGMSVAEAVIAMTLIAIVSAAAFTTVSSSIRITAKATHRYNSISLIGACLECFKCSSDKASFESALAFYGSTEKAEEVSEETSVAEEVTGDISEESSEESAPEPEMPAYTVVSDAETGIDTYTFECTGYTVTVTLDWTQRTMSATSVNADGGLLYEFAPYKAGS